uniref:Ig-like domain-containing protein n=1 Tax=Lepeophtheirus salmonis TaxID=72036 RepID=A0A0K2SXN7_LEPSM
MKSYSSRMVLSFTSMIILMVAQGSLSQSHHKSGSHHHARRAGRQNGPFFSSSPDTYREKVGETIVLFCQVENLDDSMVIWKQSNRIISAGNVVIRKDERLSLLEGFNLQIRNLRESDAGEYVCEIETYGSPLDQKSTLEILVPPRVEPQPSDGKFVVRKGSTIKLECRAMGNPMPTIIWERENNLLPSGDKALEGYSIVIQDVSRHHSGIYSCTADNKVGEPARAEIDLKVLYPPEIEVDQSWIRTEEGIEAEVSCSVHAEPKAEVKWYKDTMLLDPTNNRHMETFGNKHVLILRNVRETDFGNYSCMADNSLGRQRGSIEVSGRPHIAKIVTPNLGYFKNQYNLTWTVDSFLPIEEYRILYRINREPDYENESRKPHSSMARRHPIEWTNIIPPIGDAKPSFKYYNTFTYKGSFVFYSLNPGTEYEVIIQSRNKEGWSNATDIFRFSTRKEDYNPMELASQDQQGYSSHTSRNVPILLLLISLQLIITQHHFL